MSATITGLVSNTIYHYRAVGENVGRVFYGNDATFTTSNLRTTLVEPVSTLLIPLKTSLAAPVAIAATHVTSTSFTANWEPVSEANGYYIDISEKADFLTYVSGWHLKEIGYYPSFDVSGLTSDKSYFYRVTARNISINSDVSNVIEVKTLLPGAPSARTDSATAVSTAKATLNGAVNPHKLSTNVIFEYGTDTTYSNSIAADQNQVTGDSDTAVSATITGLKSDTNYYYRVVAKNAAGTVYGYDYNFTTPMAPKYTVKDDGTAQLNRIYFASGGRSHSQ